MSKDRDFIENPGYVDNVFKPEVINHVRTHYATHMKYGWKASGRAEYDQSHWNNQVIAKPSWIHVDLKDTPEYEGMPEIQYMWNNILPYVGKKSLLRVYCNGYTYGTDGYIHTDEGSDKQGRPGETCIIYLNEGRWDLDWAGETIVYGIDDEPLFVCKPTFGRMLIFNSQLFHRALPLSRIYGGLRTIITFKTHDPDWTEPKFLWLRDRAKDITHNTGGVSHPDGFWLHSWYVARILENDFKAKKPTCLAGYYHAAAYGTVFFTGGLEPASRTEIQSLIGSEAESLVWEYSQLPENRDEVLINRKGDWSDRTWGRLLQIDCANSWEQKTGQNSLDEKLNIIMQIQEKDEL